MGRKVYHVWGYDSGIEIFIATYTNKEEARKRTDEVLKEGFPNAVTSSYDLSNHQHLDIYILPFMAKKKEEK